MKTVDELAEAAIASLFDDEIRAEVAGCDWKSVSIIARQAVRNGLAAQREKDAMILDAVECDHLDSHNYPSPCCCATVAKNKAKEIREAN